MRIMRTMDDPTRPASAADEPPTFINTSSHWWDASQIYGTTPEYQAFVRTGKGGKLRVEPDGSLPLPPGKTDGNPSDGARLLDRAGDAAERVHPRAQRGLRHARAGTTRRGPTTRSSSAPGWSIAALIAKIHTVEWTPAVISHPTTVTALRANWFGLAGERLQERVRTASAAAS